MRYIIAPTNSDIIHSGSHKYIDRKMGKNGKWIYIYNKAHILKGRIKDKLYKHSKDYKNRVAEAYKQHEDAKKQSDERANKLREINVNKRKEELKKTEKIENERHVKEWETLINNMVEMSKKNKTKTYNRINITNDKMRRKANNYRKAFLDNRR